MMDDIRRYEEAACGDNSIKPQDISLSLIVRRHFGSDATSWSHEHLIEELSKITHVRLDREGISSLENLMLFSTKVTNVYLQHNKIENMDGLECLINLRFLTLASNRITTIRGLDTLKHLSFLDLSKNEIASFDGGSFPQSLVILNLKENPCVSCTNYKSSVLQSLPRLKQLDDVSLAEDDSEDEEAADGNNDTRALEEIVAGDVRSAASGILSRSQQSLERQFTEHKLRLQQLDGFRTPRT